jgi:hypothetical protein
MLRAHRPPTPALACRLRISLGLKPLNMQAPLQQSAVDVQKQAEERQKQEQEKMAAEMRAKIAA